LDGLTPSLDRLDVLEHDANCLNDLQVDESVVMSQNSSQKTKPISFDKSIHVSFVYPFAKHTELSYVSNHFHKKVLVPLCYTLAFVWNGLEQVNELSVWI